jgi:hypothetical protein
MVRGLVSLSCVLAVCGGMALARPVDDDKEDEGIPPDAAGGTLQRGDSPDHLPGHARGHGGSGSGVSFGSWGSGGAAEDHEPCGKRSERRPKKGMIISDITIHCLARGTQIDFDLVAFPALVLRCASGRDRQKHGSISVHL